MLEHLSHFFTQPPADMPRALGHYQTSLVVLSVVVAAALSWLALQMADIAQRTSDKKHRQATLIAGSVALGCGIWTMHFIGMFAYQLPAPWRYQGTLTLLSMLPALLAAWAALRMLIRKELTRIQLLGSGFILGAGIGTMHYGGMLAIETPLYMQHDLWLFLLSIVVAVALGTLAIGVRFGLAKLALSKNSRFWLSGLIMGSAIAGMHYTAMAAVRFYGETSAPNSGYVINHFILALGVASLAVTIAMTTTALNGLFLSRNLNQKIISSRKRLATILDTADDGIITINQLGLVQEFNRAAERLFGYQASEVLGKNINILMPEPYHSQHDGHLAKYSKTRKAHLIGVGAEVPGKRKDGSIVPLRISVGEVETEDGRLYVGVLSDISTRKELEKSLREAVKKAELAAQSKMHFLANMSHEIRTPMNAIIGFTELILQGELNDKQREHLHIIRQSSRSLLGLLNDILDTSKLENGKIELENTSFSLKSLAEQLQNTLGINAQKKHIQLESQYAQNTPEFFRGDALRLLQVLTNLVGNAIKFTEQGQVTVHYDYEQNLLKIRIQDTGIGMSAAQVEKIFEPFTQADASISRRFGGTGLGTTIANQLVQAMGGSIEVRSELKKGSEFCVTLPLEIGEAVQTTNIKTEVNLPSLRILFADDVEQNRELLRFILEKRNHKVTTASNGEEIIKYFMAEHFDLVLMDVHMPVLDGLQATKSIRAFERKEQRQATPIIALTASVMIEDRKQTQEAGMNGFAVKPIETAALFAEIARVLGYQTQAIIQSDENESSLDWQRGESLWGSREALQKQIQIFLADYPQKYSALQLHSSDNTNETIRAQAHSLKGVAGNLALLKLSRYAGEIENQIKNNPSADLNSLKENLAQEWQHLQKLAERFLEEQASLEPQKTPLDKSLLTKLLEKLQHNELDEKLIQTVLPSLSAEQAQALQQSFEAFDFKTAQQLLSEWLEK